MKILKQLLSNKPTEDRITTLWGDQLDGAHGDRLTEFDDGSYEVSQVDHPGVCAGLVMEAPEANHDTDPCIIVSQPKRWWQF